MCNQIFNTFLNIANEWLQNYGFYEYSNIVEDVNIHDTDKVKDYIIIKYHDVVDVVFKHILQIYMYTHKNEIILDDKNELNSLILKIFENAYYRFIHEHFLEIKDTYLHIEEINNDNEYTNVQHVLRSAYSLLYDLITTSYKTGSK